MLSRLPANGPYCKALQGPEPRPATKKQPSTAPSSAGSALSNAKRGSMGRSQQKGVLSLTDTSSDAAAVSQASFYKPRGLRQRSTQTTASPRPSDEMPHLEDPETGSDRLCDCLVSSDKHRSPGSTCQILLPPVNCGLRHT